MVFPPGNFQQKGARGDRRRQIGGDHAGVRNVVDYRVRNHQRRSRQPDLRRRQLLSFVEIGNRDRHRLGYVIGLYLRHPYLVVVSFRIMRSREQKQPYKKHKSFANGPWMHHEVLPLCFLLVDQRKSIGRKEHELRAMLTTFLR